MALRAWWLFLLVLLPLVACGSRTGLDVPVVREVTFHACASAKPDWIVFDLVDGSRAMPSGLYAMRADGSDGHSVAVPHAPGGHPSVSRDGGKLLYTSGNSLYMYDFASRTDAFIVRVTDSDLTYSALSPDGQTVAYVSGYTLRAIGVDGTNDRALIDGPNGDGSGYGHPVFGPDSQSVVYGTGGAIGEIRLDSSNDRTLLEAMPGSFQYPNPGFSPDLQRIVVGAFCDSSSPQALRIYSFASLPGAGCQSGTLLVEVSDGSASNLANDPSWGDNGLIAYGSGPDVFVIAPTGGAPTDMTAGLTGDGGTITASDPVWAPGCAHMP